MRKLIYCIFVVVLLSSCSDGDSCIQDLNMSMKASLYKMTYDSSIEQFTPEKDSRTITFYGLGRDSLLYDSYTTSTINIPLQKFDTISSFVLKTTRKLVDPIEEVYDTIDFYHKNEEEFISLACGCIVNNYITGVSQTTNMIDSIIIESPGVNLTSGNNIKIYLKDK